MVLEGPAGSGAPLAGVRVLDLTRVLAGPFCTMILADLGADVIKLESPHSPDYTRGLPPFAGDVSHYFLAVNRNKRSVSLDLRLEAGRRAALELALRCDALVENFRPGVLERLGLGYERLRERRPDIIVCSLSGYGQTGELSSRAAVDTVVQALSGAMSVNGEADGPPVKLGLAMGDLAGAMWAAVGVLAALHRRTATGLGEHVDVSLLDGLVSQLAYLAQLYLVTGGSPGRMGSNHHTVPAYGRYPVRDGHLVLAAQMDPFWRGFCEAAGRPELAEDPRYRTATARQDRYAEVERLVSGILLTKDLSEWTRLLDQAGVPNGPVLDVAEALEQPHVRHRLLREVDQPGAGPVRVIGPVLKFLSSPGAEPGLSHAPSLGEHTREVLESVAGLSPDAVSALLRSGAASEPRLPAPG